eukprot:27638_1
MTRKSKPQLHHQTQKYLEKTLNCEKDMLDKLRNTLKEIVNSKLGDNLQSVSNEITKLCKKKDLQDMGTSGRKLCEFVCLYLISDEEIHRMAERQNRARRDFRDLDFCRKIDILSKVSILKHNFPKKQMHFLRKKGNEQVHAQEQKEEEKETDNNEEQQEDPGKKTMRNIIECACQIIEWFWIKVQLRDLLSQLNNLDLRMPE